MKILNAALATMNAQAVTTWAVCWQVTDRLGNVYRATQHDAALTISSGTYAGTYEPFRAVSASSVRSNADMAVDNLTLESYLDAQGITKDDIDGGLFDGVTFAIIGINWKAPDDGQVVLRTGTVGELSREHEGKLSIELRGLMQALQQPIVRTYLPSCDADLGDARCTVDLAPLTITDAVSVVVNTNLAFASAGIVAADGYFTGGLLTFTTGDNAGYSREVRQHIDTVVNPVATVPPITADGVLILSEPLPNPIVVGDEFTLTPGCDKAATTCRDKFGNIPNFRGFPHIKAPGENSQATVRV